MEELDSKKYLNIDGKFKDNNLPLHNSSSSIITGWEWSFPNSEFIFGHNYPITDIISQQKVKIALFDMDGTLIDVKSKSRSPLDENDWEWWRSPEVQNVLDKCVKDGYIVAIVTNQKGISLGMVKDTEIKNKIEKLTKILNIPILALISSHDNQYRKPQPGMFKFLKELLEKNSNEIDMDSSFFVGDGAGRPKTKYRFKDHTDAD